MSVSSSKKAKKGTNGFHFNTEDSVEGMKTSILNHLKFTLARDLGSAGARDYGFRPVWQLEIASLSA